MKTRMKAVFFGLVFALLCQPAEALSISGDIAFSGLYTVDNPDLTLATEFTAITGTVLAATGDYTGTETEVVTFSAFSWDPFTAPLSPAWTFTDGSTFSFDYLTLIEGGGTTATSITLSGTGLASISGFEDTNGTWTLTANTTGSLFSYSADAAVPDGGTTASLLGLALLGFGVVHRKLLG